MIDSPTNSHRWDKGHEDSELDEEHSSVFESVTESPVRYPPGSSAEASPYNGRGRSCTPEWGSETPNGDELNGTGSARATPDASLWSPAREEPAIEAGRFKRAVDVLARHYGGGRQMIGRRRGSEEPYGSPTLSHGTEACTYPEEDEEIKV